MRDIEDCVLPEPDSPTIATTSPGWTSYSTSIAAGNHSPST